MNLLERIDRWAATDPDRVAHVSGAETLTYGALTARSDAVAAELRRRLPDDRSPIAILGHKEPEMIVAFLAAIKSGHPYVPIDDALPRQRFDSILATSGAAFTLTPVFTRECGTVASDSARGVPLSSDDPFYIIFTSGSTGIPKGVPITLGCLTDFMSWMEDEQRFSDDEVFLNQVPFSFDVSILDTYLALVSGGTIFSITRDHIANPIRLYQDLARAGVTVWTSTPSFVQLCQAERRFAEAMLPRLTRFFLAGEALPRGMVAQLFERFPRAAVWNMYGPTEATVVTTSVRVDREMLERYPSVPIGYPKPRTTIEIHSADGRPVPPGERGEIVIAGPNVSHGYLNRPDASERAFFRLHGQRAYRTGDAGRYVDGLLLFEGRLDNQIKLHGYRIELGDIEAHLAALPNVVDAVVLPMMKNERVESLHAFVALRERPAGSDFEIGNALRSELASRLPIHMLPRRFRVLDRFPLTVNGKADRAKLREIARTL